MKTYRSTPLPGLCALPPSSSSKFVHSSDGTTSNPDTITDVIWAGYVGQASSSNRYVAASGEYDQPPRNFTYCDDAHVSSWVGIGGFRPRNNGSYGLIQAGTISPPSGSAYAFWEYTGVDSDGSPIGQQNAQRIQNLDVTRGDHIHDSVFYQTSNNQADFVVQNESNGQFQSIIKTISQQFYDGRDADYVIERSKSSPARHDFSRPAVSGGRLIFSTGGQ
ncbi:MAG TPA: G1 family glutamic endopeptidase [Nocardioidaceae bacterium]|nr:G1 family glutamic endopeptidase [Nocardioidaceae bacterium]